MSSTGDPLEERHVKRFRDLVWKAEGGFKEPSNYKLRTEVDGNSDFVSTCKVIHKGASEIEGDSGAVGVGEGIDACDEALDEFEHLINRM